MSPSCYWPDGSPTDFSYVACTPTATHSVCCSSGDSCVGNGLCYSRYGSVYRGGCTDSTWQTNECARVCKNGSSPPPPLHLLSSPPLGALNRPANPHHPAVTASSFVNLQPCYIGASLSDKSIFCCWRGAGADPTGSALGPFSHFSPALERSYRRMSAPPKKPSLVRAGTNPLSWGALSALRLGFCSSRPWRCCCGGSGDA